MAPGTCPTSYRSTSSSDSTMRTVGSLACSTTQSVLTNTSGCTYSAIYCSSSMSNPALNGQTNALLHPFHGELRNDRLKEPLDDHALRLLTRQATAHQIKNLLVVHHASGRAVLAAHVIRLNLQDGQCIGACFIAEQQAMRRLVRTGLLCRRLQVDHAAQDRTRPVQQRTSEQ